MGTSQQEEFVGETGISVREGAPLGGKRYAQITTPGEDGPTTLTIDIEDARALAHALLRVVHAKPVESDLVEVDIQHPPERWFRSHPEAMPTPDQWRKWRALGYDLRGYGEG